MFRRFVSASLVPRLLSRGNANSDFAAPLLPSDDYPGLTLGAGLISLARCLRYQMPVTLLKLSLKALCVRELRRKSVDIPAVHDAVLS
jgi:hypothetical protein